MRNFKNKLSLFLAVLLVFTCVVGSLAYFTDRITANASLETMENPIDIKPEIDPDVDPDDPTKDPEDYVDPTPNDPTDDLSNWWAYVNSVAMVNYNPGDVMQLNYKLTNAGQMDVKIRETFIITSSVPMTDGAEEFKLCTGYTTVSTGGYAANATAGMTFTKLSNNQYKVTVAESALSANGSVDKDYYMVFATTATNAFQGATVTITYVVEAMQADGDWATVVTSTMTFDGQELEVVPEA